MNAEHAQSKVSCGIRAAVRVRHCANEDRADSASTVQRGPRRAACGWAHRVSEDETGCGIGAQSTHWRIAIATANRHSARHARAMNYFSRSRCERGSIRLYNDTSATHLRSGHRVPAAVLSGRCPAVLAYAANRGAALARRYRTARRARQVCAGFFERLLRSATAACRRTTASICPAFAGTLGCAGMPWRATLDKATSKRNRIRGSVANGETACLR